MSSLRLIGYWRSEFDPKPWPDPHDFVDDQWPSVERQMVVSYLQRGRTLEQYRGLSPCRFCGQYLGSKELTDGTYCWPEGLAHYLAEHDVRLPDEFVTHVESSANRGEVLPAPQFDHLGQRLRGGGFDDEYEAWTTSTREHFLNGGKQEELPPNWLNAGISYDWWLRHEGRTPLHDG
jgi:hypothetical protein